MLLLVAGAMLSPHLLDEVWLARQIEEAANQRITGRLTVGRASFHFPLGLGLETVELADTRGEVLARVERLHAQVDLLPLLRRVVSVGPIGATGVWLTARQGDDGKLDLVAALAPRGPPSDGPAWPVHVDGVNVEIDRLRLDVPEGHVQVSAAQLTGGAATSTSEGITVELGEFSGSVELDLGAERRTPSAVAVDATGLTYRGGGEASTLTVAQAHAAIAGVSVSAAGELAWASTLSRLNLQIALRGELASELLAPARARLPLLQDAAGGVEIEAQLSKAGASEPFGASGTVRLRQVVVASMPAVDATAQVEFADDRIDLRQLELVVQGGRVRGNVELDRRSMSASGVLRLENLQARTLLAAWLDPALLPQRVAGQITIGRLALTPWAFDGSVDLRLDGIDLPPAVEQPLHLTGELQAGAERLQLAEVRVVAGSAHVSASGTIGLQSGAALRLDIEAGHDAPEALWRDRGIPLRVSSVRLRGTVEGTRSAPRFVGGLELAGVRAQVGPEAEIRAQVIVEPTGVTLRSATVATAAGEVAVDGTLSWQGAAPSPPLRVDVRANTDALRLEALGLPLGQLISGEASGRLTLSGPTDDPVARLDAAVSGLTVGTAVFGPARVTAGWRAGEATVDELVIDVEAGGTLRARGALTPARESWSVSSEVDGVSLAWLAALSGKSVAVRGTLHGVGSAHRRDGVDTAEAQLSCDDATWDDQKVGTLQLRGRLNDGVAVSELSFSGPLGTARADATLSLPTRQLQGSLRWQQFDLRRLALLWPGASGVQGIASATVDLGGSVEQPQVKAELNIPRLAFADAPLGRLLLTLSGPAPGGGRVFEHNVLLTRGEAKAAASGSVDPFSGALTSHISLTGLDIAPLAASLRQANVSAVVDAEADLTLSPDSGMTLVGDIRALRLDGLGESAALDKPAHLRWDGQHLSVHDLSLRGKRTRFRANLDISDSLSVEADGEVEVAYLQPFVRAVSSADGIAGISLRVTGARDHPIAVGTVRPITPVRIRPRGLPADVRWHGGQLELAADELRLVDITGRYADAPFMLGGSVALTGLRPSRYDLSVIAEQLEVRSRAGRVEMDVDLRLTGSGPWPNVSGRIDILYGRLDRRFVLRDLRLVRERSTAPALREQYPWLRDIGVDVRIASRGPIDLGIDAGPFALIGTAQADVAVRGTAAAPEPAGWIAIDAGQLRFPAGELDILSGTVELDPGTLVGEARVQLSAEGEVEPRSSGAQEVSSYLVHLDLNGTLNQLDLNLRSDPTLDRLEALALLATGRAGAVWGGGMGRGDLDYALALASGQLATPLTDYLSEQLAKLVNVHLQLNTEVSSRALTVGANKRVNRRLRLEGAYQQLFYGNSGVGSARVQLLLTDRIFLEGQTRTATAADTDSGADVGPQHQLQLKLRLLGE